MRAEARIGLGILGFVFIASIMTMAYIGSYEAKKQQAIDILSMQSIGVTKIEWTIFGCGADDEFKFAWSGNNRDNKPVEGYACSGYLKGVTIRYK